MLTTEALQALWCHSAILSQIVRAQLVEDTGNGDRVCQQLRRLPHFPVLVQRIKVSCVQVSIPTGHVHQDLLHLWFSKLKLLEEPSTPQIVIVLIRLPQYIADLQMCFIIIRPMFLTAVYWYPTIWTFKVYVGWWGTCFGRFAGFEVHWVIRCSRWLMRRMWAVCMLSHESCSFAYLRNGRVREGIKEVVFCQNKLALNTFWINVLVGLEWFIKSAAWGCRKRSPRQGKLWVRRSFGGVIPPGRDILGERSEWMRRLQLRA
jgi:hypothetical protein